MFGKLRISLNKIKISLRFFTNFSIFFRTFIFPHPIISSKF